jgi:hypothetical protein
MHQRIDVLLKRLLLLLRRILTHTPFFHPRT